MHDTELTRYSRHLLLNEWSLEAQTQLAAARILIVGMGGLGCPTAHHLAAAGVGHLTLADGDVVDASNLQRQYLHTAHSIGRLKVDSAKSALAQINPGCQVSTYASRLEGAALLSMVAAHDVVLDCSDNFATRHAINRACTAYGKPLFSGAAIRFDGQLIAFHTAHADSPCYHCLFPEQGVEDEADRCAVMGVFAPLTAQIGTLQAAAALRFIAGVGTQRWGQLHLVNALTGTQQTLRVPRDAGCEVCATRSAV